MKRFNCIKQCFVVAVVLLLFANVLCIGCFDCNGVFEKNCSPKIEPVTVCVSVGMAPAQNGGVVICNVEQLLGEQAKGGSLLWDDQNFVASMVGDFAPLGKESAFAVSFKNNTQSTVVLGDVLSDKMQVDCDSIEKTIAPGQTVCCRVDLVGCGENCKLDFCFFRQCTDCAQNCSCNF
ncbi:MAG: hypothetical protein IKV34_01840 [Clostridia bacterium]|nr:hypothetical protein [Clostridia bacterium]